MTLRGSRRLSDPWRLMRPRTGCRELSAGREKLKLTDGGGGKWHGEDAGAGEGGVDPEFNQTERSSDLFVGKRCSWVLPAPGPRLGGSALPEPGQGALSWRTCLAFSSAHSSPRRSRFFPLRAPAGDWGGAY